MKKQLLLTRMLLLFALIVGSTSVWADETPEVTLDFTSNTNWGFPSGSSNKTTTKSDYTSGDYTITLGGGGSGNGHYWNSTDKYLLMGQSGAYLDLPAFSFPVSKIVVIGRTGASGKVKQNIFVGTTGVSTETTGAAGSNTYNINSSYQAAGNIYTLKVNSAHNTQITKIEIYRVAKSNLTSFAFGTPEPSVQLSKNGSVWEADYTQTVNYAPNTYTGTITYSIDTENSIIPTGLTVTVSNENATKGKVSVSATTNEEALVVVKASGAGTDLFNAPNDASYTLSVTEAPAGVGTPTFGLETGSYYYGTTTTISAANADKIYYTTDNSTPSKTNGTLYSSPVAITQTMTLKAIGYDGETAGEVGSINFTLKAPETPTVSLASGGVEEGTEVELTMGDGGSKVVYTTDGTDPTASSTTYSSAIEINSPITLKAATVDGGNNLSSIVTRTYNIVVNKEVTLWSENFSSYSANDIPDGGTYSYKCVDGGSETKIYNELLAGGAKPELLVGKTSGYFQATVPLDNNAGNLQLKFKTNAKGITISTTTDGISISGDSSFNTAEEHTVTFTGVTTSMTEVVIKFATNSSDNVRLDDIVLKGYKPTATQPVTIGASGFASYCSTSALDFSEANVNAYKAKVNADNVVLTKLEKVPANVGMILYSDNSGNYNIPVAESAPAVTDNEMIGVTERTQINWNVDGKYNYILQSGQFNKANGGYLKANRAYLSTTYEIAEGKELTIIFDEDIEEENETNGIRSIKGDETSSLRYNLAGQKVSKDYKGIVIINGKKMLNK